jgi:hypothetical protein
MKPHPRVSEEEVEPPGMSEEEESPSVVEDERCGRPATCPPSHPTKALLAVIKCIYLPPTYLHFIQDIEDRSLLVSRVLLIYHFKNIG